ncbi:IS1634 family transposase [Fusobacterium sp. PH5-44]|uniref:IS1634 family transposase n=1 Tax=unclassified Fusobacterium TaxID=2648384 RepID=UPI003D1BA2B6
MYLECFKNNGRDYLRISEGYRVKRDDGTFTTKRRVIKNLGSIEKFDDGKPDLLQRLREDFKNGKLEIEGFEYTTEKIKDYITIRIDAKVPLTLNPKNIGYFFLDDLFINLGISEVLTQVKSSSKINYDLNGLTKLLVFGRILNPDSKKATFEEKDKYLLPVTSSNEIKEIYRTLDVLNEKANTIQSRMNKKIKKMVGRNTSITYYDVTNYYFETGSNDEDFIDESTGEIISGLRKKGVSKENRKEPIVQMGLFIDSNGLPISYGLYPGNTQDKTTFKDMIASSISKISSEKIVVVCDNGMNTQENIYLLKKDGNGYILSKSIKKSWTSYKEWIQDESDYIVTYNKDKEITYKYKSRIVDKIVKDKFGNEMEIQEKEIVFWSKKQYEKQKYENKKFYEYLESCKEQPSKLKDKQRKSQKFMKVIQTDKKTGEEIKTKAKIIILDEKMEKYRDTMGFYMLITSEIDEDDKSIINRYHGLSRIEDSFRIIKSDLEGRPVYVRTKEHINAHFLVCFIALTIIRLLQYKILKSENKETLNTDGWEQGITAEKLKESLKNFNANLLINEYYQISTIDQDLKKLIKSYELDDFTGQPTRTQIKKFKNQINFM